MSIKTKRRWLAVAGACLLVGVVVGVFRAVGVLPGRNADRVAPQSSLNVLMIVADTLRADHLGVYGYSRDTSPNIDGFAASSFVFKNARSQSSCTFPSVASMLTSHWGQEFFGQTDGRIGVAERFPYLPRILRDAGYATVAISASPIIRNTPGHFNKHGGYGDGFTDFDETCAWPKGAAPCVTRNAISWLDRNNEPFFMYLHYMDVHGPYQTPDVFRRFAPQYESDKEFLKEKTFNVVEKMLYGSEGKKVEVTPQELEYMIDHYDEGIAYFDHFFGRLIRDLDRRGVLGNTIIVLSSDHGEEFLEHNSVKHCHTLFDTEVNVPLIIFVPRLPGSVEKEQLVSNLDIVPTILDYLQLELPKNLEGRSLRATAESQQSDSGTSFSVIGSLRSIVHDDHKLIYDLETGDTRVFNVRTDPKEQADIGGVDVARTEELKTRLLTWVERVEGEVASSAGVEAIDQLRSLGYLE